MGRKERVEGSLDSTISDHTIRTQAPPVFGDPRLEVIESVGLECEVSKEESEREKQLPSFDSSPALPLLLQVSVSDSLVSGQFPSFLVDQSSLQGRKRRQRSSVPEGQRESNPKKSSQGMRKGLQGRRGRERERESRDTGRT